MAVAAMLAATTTAYLPGVTMSLPQLSASPRHRALQMGFEIEDVTEKAVGEMGVFGWPGLAKQSADFSQSAAADELLMVYVKEGKGTISDGEETASVAAGQMVMISDGSVQWSGIETELVLISTTTALADVDEFSVDTLVAPKKVAIEDDPVDDLSLKDAGLLLAAGLAAGAIASFGFKTFNTPPDLPM